MVLDIIFLFLRQSERQAIQVGCIFLPAIFLELERLRKTLETKNRNCTAPLITWETSEYRNISTDSLIISSYLTVQATQRNLSHFR